MSPLYKVLSKALEDKTAWELRESGYYSSLDMDDIYHSKTGMRFTYAKNGPLPNTFFPFKAHRSLTLLERILLGRKAKWMPRVVKRHFSGESSHDEIMAEFHRRLLHGKPKDEIDKQSIFQRNANPYFIALEKAEKEMSSDLAKMQEEVRRDIHRILGIQETP